MARLEHLLGRLAANDAPADHAKVEKRLALLVEGRLGDHSSRPANFSSARSTSENAIVSCSTSS